jgi:hypothetical protein
MPCYKEHKGADLKTFVASSAAPVEFGIYPECVLEKLVEDKTFKSVIPVYPTIVGCASCRLFDIL